MRQLCNYAILCVPTFNTKTFDFGLDKSNGLERKYFKNEGQSKKSSPSKLGQEILICCDFKI